MRKEYVLDTNICLFFIRNEDFRKGFTKIYSFEESIFFVSSVTLGELNSLAKQNNWGENKIMIMDNFLNKCEELHISEKIIEMYGTIDAYSQGKLAKKPLPAGMSARNMGKNDLWIAATTAVSNATLITADNDFDHLNFEFIRIDKIQY
jgi:tRNA(fMet)-specific endonuclease VapC